MVYFLYKNSVPGISDRQTNYAQNKNPITDIYEKNRRPDRISIL
jgi:hypothetical protein